MDVEYEIWIINRDTYTRVTMIESMVKLRYSQKLNTYGSCMLIVDADYVKVPDLAQQAALVVYRNGVERFSGIINRTHYQADTSAPSGETWTVEGQDRTSYLKWTLIPCIGIDSENRSGPADDVMKDYVRYHAGSLAGTRARSDVVVAANASAAPTYPAEARNIYLLTLLQNIADGAGVWFRIEPNSAAGTQTFTTAYPLWGMDRSRGNGINPELVLSFDRRNFEELFFTDDRLDLCNAVYVGGGGEGAERNIRLRTDADSITANLRREKFHEDRNSTLDATLNAHGDAFLVANGPRVWMTGVPREDLWPGSYDLGDKVTVTINRGSLAETHDIIITGLTVTVEKMVETVAPEMIEA